MDKEERYEQSEYSLEDLEQFRDEKGFIDLTRAGITFSEKSREYLGNNKRLKNWVNFNGTKALVKGEAILDEDKNLGIYAELIVEEIAKKLGIPAAHYDLVKMLNEDGKETLGVLSVSIVDKDKKEDLETLHSIIGYESETIESAENPTTSYHFTIQALESKLLEEGYDRENIDKVIEEYKKRTALSILLSDTDKHPENVAFIRKKGKDGKNIIEIAPVFDSEASFLLDMDIPTLERLLEDYEGLVRAVGCAQPRIAVEDGELGMEWADTLEALIEEDAIYDFCMQISSSIDMDEILGNVEARIGAKLPQSVKLISKYAFDARKTEFIQVLDGSYYFEHEQDEEPNNSFANQLLASLQNRGKGLGISDFQNMMLRLQMGEKEGPEEPSDTTREEIE